MGQLYVDTIEPQSGTSLTIGESGQNTVLAGNDIRANVLQDAGGNAIFTSNGSGTISGVNSAFGSSQVLLNTTTLGSATANVDFTTAISGAFTSTYWYYEWHFFNLEVSSQPNTLQFLLSNDGSAWSPTKTGSFQRAQNNTGNNNIAWGYQSSLSLSNSANAMPIASDLGNDSGNEALCGILRIWDVTSTTRQNAWISKTVYDHSGDYVQGTWTAGHTGGTGAIVAIRFQLASNNINSGAVFKMYGFK